MHRIGRTFPIALFVVALAGCNDDGSLTAVKGELETQELVDFGPVQVGILMPFELPVTNKGTGALSITNTTFGPGFTEQNYEFKLSENSFTLQPNQTKNLTVSFQPFASHEMPVESFFRFTLSENDEAGNPITFTVTVRGQGVTSGIEVSPNPVDFGNVLVGSSRILEVTVTNRLQAAVDIKTQLSPLGTPEIVNQGGLGRFELLDPEPDPARGGSLLPADTMLAEGESTTVRLRYIPDPSQADVQDRGRWTISNCDNALCDLDVVLLGKGTNSAIECEPAAIDFGQINPGVVATRNTTCTNVASENVTVLGWQTGLGTASEYNVQPFDGSVTNLGPGEQFDVEVQFSPTLASVGTDPAGALVINGRNPVASRDLTPVQVALSGTAGGPDIAVLPSAVNFGQIAIGTTGKKRILVENTGFNELTVSSIDGDATGSGAFTANRQAFIVPPGGSEIIEVDFTPLAEGLAMSEVVIESDDVDEGQVRIPVQGLGVLLPPCSYEVSPTEINFGIVQVLRNTTQGLRIRNTGADDCLVNDIELSPDSSVAFSLINGVETGVIIAPGEEKTVLIGYTPDSEAVDMGLLTFYISDPGNSNPEVRLRGVGSASALLISPNEVDFGQIGVGCNTRERAITIYNTGSSPTSIERIELPQGVTTEFILGNLPAGVPAPPGAVIQPGQSIEFTVRYQATDLGQDTGFLHIFESGAMDPYVLPLFAEGAKDPINRDEFEQLETPEVDILFVIDNSCSMSEEQASLTANFASFIQFADSQALDYRISVVSTDVDGCPNPAQAQRPGLLDQGQCGYFADGNGAGTQRNPDWRLITPGEQPSAEQAFAAIGTQGIDGSGTERGLEAAYLALSSPLITGWNQGFLRPSAYLALIFISDEEDQSTNSVDFYVNYFLAIKGFRNTNLFSASAIVGDPTSLGTGGGCGGFQADAGDRYVNAAERTGGIFESICTTDWAQALQNLGLSVFGYKSKFFLSNQPVPGTVEVTVDGVPVASTAANGQVRWGYDPATNAVSFAPLAIPEPGSQIVITYQAECL